MGKGSGGGSQPQYVQSPPQTTTTTQVANTTPWSGQQGYLTDIFAKAQGQYGSPLEFYGGSVPGVPTGQTYAPFSPETQAAMGLTANQAITNPIPKAATDFSADLLSGDYLSAGNPYFSNMVKSITERVTPQVESQFEGAGRYGSGAMDKALASAVTDTAGNLAYQNYADTMKNMSQAAYIAPQTAQLGLLPAQEIAQVGGIKEDQIQNAINQAMQQWQFTQMEPWQRLGMYSGEVGGNYGGTSTSTGTGTGSPAGQWTQPSYNNTWGNVGSVLGGLGGLGLLAYSAFSDIETKNNIEPITDALRLIDLLNPVTFDYKPEYGIPGQVGFVADEIEDLIPGMVFTGIDGLKKLFPFAVVPLLVKAVQELQEQVRQLRGADQNLVSTTKE